MMSGDTIQAYRASVLHFAIIWNRRLMLGGRLVHERDK